MTSTPARSARTALSTVGACLALAACGGGPAAPAPPEGPAVSSPAPAAPAPSPAPPPSAPPLPTAAADGTNYAACADGTCEVAVSKPVRIRLPTGQLVVTRIDDNGVAVELDLAAGTATATLKSTCGSVLRVGAGGQGSFTGCGDDGVATPPAPEPGTVALQLANRLGNTAILRIVSG